MEVNKEESIQQTVRLFKRTWQYGIDLNSLEKITGLVKGDDSIKKFYKLYLDSLKKPEKKSEYWTPERIAEGDLIDFIIHMEIYDCCPKSTSREWTVALSSYIPDISGKVRRSIKMYLELRLEDRLRTEP